MCQLQCSHPELRKCVGEGREEDTTEERCEGKRERRFRLKLNW